MSSDGQDYDERPIRSHVVGLAKAHDGPVLEIGTGSCACMALSLALNGLQVTAVDLSAEAIRLARQKARERKVAAQITFRRADAARLPFDKGSYGVVVAFDALYHASHPEQVLAEMFRVCASDGLIIITELNAAGRKALRHKDNGVERRLPGLLSRHCRACERVQAPYHKSFVCQKKGE
ncbi:MAG: class I SAM-dependent methyltransferase [Chloroflexi bacterium]|nr:class I SAM-dependent methyltransferase [Chloroflexota bacterium]